MLELIAIVCGAILLLYLPHEAGKVRGGWIRKNYKGSPEDFRAAYPKQLTYYMWTGIGIGAVNLVLTPLAQEPGEWIFKLLAAAIWLGVAGVSAYHRSRWAAQPA